MTTPKNIKKRVPVADRTFTPSSSKPDFMVHECENEAEAERVLRSLRQNARKNLSGNIFSLSDSKIEIEMGAEDYKKWDEIRKEKKPIISTKNRKFTPSTKEGIMTHKCGSIKEAQIALNSLQKSAKRTLNKNNVFTLSDNKIEVEVSAEDYKEWDEIRKKKKRVYAADRTFIPSNDKLDFMVHECENEAEAKQVLSTLQKNAKRTLNKNNIFTLSNSKTGVEISTEDYKKWNDARKIKPRNIPLKDRKFVQSNNNPNILIHECSTRESAARLLYSLNKSAYTHLKEPIFELSLNKKNIEVNKEKYNKWFVQFESKRKKTYVTDRHFTRGDDKGILTYECMPPELPNEVRKTLNRHSKNILGKRIFSLKKYTIIVNENDYKEWQKKLDGKRNPSVCDALNNTEIDASDTQQNQNNLDIASMISSNNAPEDFSNAENEDNSGIKSLESFHNNDDEVIGYELPEDSGSPAGSDSSDAKTLYDKTGKQEVETSDEEDFSDELGGQQYRSYSRLLAEPDEQSSPSSDDETYGSSECSNQATHHKPEEAPNVNCHNSGPCISPYFTRYRKPQLCGRQQSTTDTAKNKANANHKP